ncbi:hypothetical protein EV182_001682, partial [Spiromyces aspiralis]
GQRERLSNQVGSDALPWTQKRDQVLDLLAGQHRDRESWVATFQQVPRALECREFLVDFYRPAHAASARVDRGTPVVSLNHLGEALVEEHQYQQAVQLFSSIESPGFCPSRAVVDGLLQPFEVTRELVSRVVARKAHRGAPADPSMRLADEDKARLMSDQQAVLTYLRRLDASIPARRWLMPSLRDRHLNSGVAFLDFLLGLLTVVVPPPQPSGPPGRDGATEEGGVDGDAELEDQLHEGRLGLAEVLASALCGDLAKCIGKQTNGRSLVVHAWHRTPPADDGGARGAMFVTLAARPERQFDPLSRVAQEVAGFASAWLLSVDRGDGGETRARAARVVFRVLHLATVLAFVRALDEDDLCARLATVAARLSPPARTVMFKGIESDILAAKVIHTDTLNRYRPNLAGLPRAATTVATLTAVFEAMPPGRSAPGHQTRAELLTDLTHNLHHLTNRAINAYYERSVRLFPAGSDGGRPPSQMLSIRVADTLGGPDQAQSHLARLRAAITGYASCVLAQLDEEAEQLARKRTRRDHRDQKLARVEQCRARVATALSLLEFSVPDAAAGP